MLPVCMAPLRIEHFSIRFIRLSIAGSLSSCLAHSIHICQPYKMSKVITETRVIGQYINVSVSARISR